MMTLIWILFVPLIFPFVFSLDLSDVVLEGAILVWLAQGHQGLILSSIGQLSVQSALPAVFPQRFWRRSIWCLVFVS
jgi:hypothetical protein